MRPYGRKDIGYSGGDFLNEKLMCAVNLVLFYPPYRNSFFVLFLFFYFLRYHYSHATYIDHGESLYVINYLNHLLLLTHLFEQSV